MPGLTVPGQKVQGAVPVALARQSRRNHEPPTLPHRTSGAAGTIVALSGAIDCSLQSIFRKRPREASSRRRSRKPGVRDRRDREAAAGDYTNAGAVEHWTLRRSLLLLMLSSSGAPRLEECLDSPHQSVLQYDVQQDRTLFVPYRMPSFNSFSR